MTEKERLDRLDDIVFHNVPFGGTYEDVTVEVNLLDLEYAMRKINRTNKILRAIKYELEEEQ